VTLRLGRRAAHDTTAAGKSTPAQLYGVPRRGKSRAAGAAGAGGL